MELKGGGYSAVGERCEKSGEARGTSALRLRSMAGLRMAGTELSETDRRAEREGRLG